MARFEKVPTSEFHPGYGCIIMALAATVFGGILWWGWYSLVTMDREIGALTQETAMVLPEVPPVPGLEQTRTEFATAAQAGKAAVLQLSVAEINALLVLAPEGTHGSYKDMLRVKALDPARQLLIAAVSLPMNTAKFWEDKRRYLIGEIDFHVEMTGLGPDAKVQAVRVPGKTVPEGMVQGMQMYGYLGPYQSHPTLGPVLKAIQQAKVETDGLRLSTEAAK